MILVDYAMKTNVLIFPALPARLRRDPLQSQCFSSPISWVWLQELWHVPPLQLCIHDNATNVGSKRDWAIQGRRNFKIEFNINEFLKFQLFRSEGGIPNYLTSKVSDNRRYFTKGHVSIRKVVVMVLLSWNVHWLFGFHLFEHQYLIILIYHWKYESSFFVKLFNASFCLFSAGRFSIVYSINQHGGDIWRLRERHCSSFVLL